MNAVVMPTAALSGIHAASALSTERLNVDTSREDICLLSCQYSRCENSRARPTHIKYAANLVHASKRDM